MKVKITVILALLILGSAGLVLSEDQTEPNPPAAAAPQENTDSNTQWVWGEVTAVDSPGKTLTLKYLDYETDQEKELLLVVDESTSYENIKSLEDIQPKDNLSVDYTLKDGKNVAKSISLEKPESSPAENSAVVAPPAETTTGTDKPETSAQAPQAN